MLSFGYFPGVWIIYADVSEHSICSIFIGIPPAYEDGRDRVFRNVGIYNSDAGELPKRKHNILISTHVSTCFNFPKTTKKSLYSEPVSLKGTKFRRSMMIGLITYLHAAWRRILLEKLAVSHLVKKFPAFYVTQSFTTMFTTACHLSLLWARSIHTMPPHSIAS